MTARTQETTQDRTQTYADKTQTVEAPRKKLGTETTNSSEGDGTPIETTSEKLRTASKTHDGGSKTSEFPLTTITGRIHCRHGSFPRHIVGLRSSDFPVSRDSRSTTACLETLSLQMATRASVASALAVLCFATSVLAQPKTTRVKRWLGFGGYNGYDIGYAYGWQIGEIIALVCGIVAFLLCICCPCICFLGIWFAGWFGIREKRRRPRESVHLTSQAVPLPATAAPTIIQQNPPPTHFSYNGGPPPRAHGEPVSRGQYVYAQDRYYERRHSPSREKYYR
ncbi:hypothetical protein QR680_009188 [Steinernema hermaphroditum]|uniref:Uncharacterized protein n=1 Tax=Steinernema hermaphroditum TaxID=289476 RepID=A0AA39IL64_9BILA|nr:hypothetical protein QR680_009188 [Steinernema hermaphroditum]